MNILCRLQSAVVMVRIAARQAISLSHAQAPRFAVTYSPGGLVMQLFDDEILALDRTGDGRVERCLLWNGPESYHVEELSPELLALDLPLRDGGSPGENPVTNPGDLVRRYFSNMTSPNRRADGDSVERRQTERHCRRLREVDTLQTGRARTVPSKGIRPPFRAEQEKQGSEDDG